MVERRLRIGVTGAGYFGRFHALKVAAGPRAVLVGVHDADPARAMAVAAEAGSVGLGFAELLAAADAVVVAAPAAVHFTAAGAALRAGKHVLVEKPIAATLVEADGLAALAAERGLVLQVGHLERFSAAFAAVRARVRGVRRIVASRVAPFKARGTDVSVVLDLMIHDLDLVLALVGAEPVWVRAEGAVGPSGLLDTVTARLGFADGAEAVVTASREAPSVERRMRVEMAGGVLEVDFVGRMVVERAAGRAPGGADVTHAWTEHDSLAAEHAGFVASVLDGVKVVVDAAAGRAALAVALAVERAALGSE